MGGCFSPVRVNEPRRDKSSETQTTPLCMAVQVGILEGAARGGGGGWVMAELKSAYQIKLEDPRWGRRHDQIVARDGGRCTRCTSQVELEVHHRYYLTGHEPWEYEDDALQTLYDPCHRLETAHPGRYEEPRGPGGLIHISETMPSTLRMIAGFYGIGKSSRPGARK